MSVKVVPMKRRDLVAGTWIERRVWVEGEKRE